MVILHRARLVLGWVTFTSSNRVRTLSVFNQPPRPTQPGHPAGVGKMSTGVKTEKVMAGYGRGVVLASMTLSVCSLPTQDLGNGVEHLTIVAEL